MITSDCFLITTIKPNYSVEGNLITLCTIKNRTDNEIRRKIQ